MISYLRGGLCLVLLMAGAAGVSGCQEMKADAAPASGFLDNTSVMSEQRDRFPFNKAWVKPGVSRSDYRTVYIAPVNTAYLMANSGWDDVGTESAGEIRQKAVELAIFMERTFRDAVRDNPEAPLDLADKPGADTMVLEMAIVELVPTKRALGALGLLGPLGKVPAVLAIGSKAAGKGSIAVEARVRDGGTGAVIAQFADREEGKTAPIDVQAVTLYGFAEEIIEEWSEQFIELISTPPTHQVEDSSAFRLSPW